MTPRCRSRSAPVGRATLLALCLASLPPLAIAQSSGGIYTLRKFAIAGGGAGSAGADISTVGTAGQGAAHVSAGGDYRLVGGFHQGAGGGDGALFKDGFESTSP